MPMGMNTVHQLGEVRSRDELDLFERRLAQVIAWCSRNPTNSDARNSLRTPALDPRAPRRDETTSRYEWLNRVDGPRIFEALVEARARLLRALDHYQHSSPGNLAGGRLLIAAPQRSVWDGAAEVESQGFFDIEDAPPWDTWVWLVSGDARGEAEPYGGIYLVSWVPPHFLEAAGAGVRVNPVGNLQWAEEIDTAFTRALTGARLI